MNGLVVVPPTSDSLLKAIPQLAKNLRTKLTRRRLSMHNTCKTSRDVQREMKSSLTLPYSPPLVPTFSTTVKTLSALGGDGQRLRELAEARDVFAFVSHFRSQLAKEGDATKPRMSRKACPAC
eukprot:5664917-Amphidinium_carterae.1